MMCVREDLPLNLLSEPRPAQSGAGTSVGREGLEPSILSEHAPKACAYTKFRHLPNSATDA